MASLNEEQAMMISVNVITDDPQLAVKAAEVLARAATGLMLEGCPSVSFNIVKGLNIEED